MFSSMPSVLSQSGINFTVQTVETTDSHILVRVRSADMVPGKHHASALAPAIADEALTLSDHHGTSTPMIHMSSSSGPFLGIVDIAYAVDEGIDLTSPLTLSSSKALLTFRL